MAYNYFKYFLETKMISVILDLWNIVLQYSIQENSNKILESNNESDKNNFNQVNQELISHITVLNESLLKLPEEIRNKVFYIIGKNDKIVSFELNSLKSALYEILLE